jgi:NAD(P)-dependent dehydrogenase (short-subunit alcohol dehydrogenase family)
MVNDVTEKNAQFVAADIQAHGGEALAHSADASNPSAIRHMFLALSRWGHRLDILVCESGRRYFAHMLQAPFFAPNMACGACVDRKLAAGSFSSDPELFIRVR